MPAETLNIADPPHIVPPLVGFAVSAIVKPLPAGSPAIVVDTVELFATLIVPVFVKPLGPLIVQPTLLIVTPGATMSASSTLPTSLASSVPGRRRHGSSRLLRRTTP